MNDVYDLNNFNYTFPHDLIAQQPLEKRDMTRLLVVDRKSGSLREVVFKDIIGLLHPGDVVVLNNTKVIRARLQANKKTGAKLDLLLLREEEGGLWEVLIKPAKRIRPNDVVLLNETGDFYAQIVGITPQGTRLIQFTPHNIHPLLEKYGKVPLPPYIKKEINNEEQYQTVFAQREGAIAAPTAGFHFTEALLENIKSKGIEIVYITLHCGLSTFRPVKTSDIRKHTLGSEVLEISPSTAQVINQAKKRGGNIVAVGTTTVRAVESSALLKNGAYCLLPQTSQTSFYIVPGYRFKIVDTLVTNFHTPHSTNLILVASFCGLELAHKAYQHAIDRRFRFFSFGDAMVIT